MNHPSLSSTTAQRTGCPLRVSSAERPGLYQWSRLQPVEARGTSFRPSRTKQQIRPFSQKLRCPSESVVPSPGRGARGSCLGGQEVVYDRRDVKVQTWQTGTCLLLALRSTCQTVLWLLNPRQTTQEASSIL
ncbi:hypothetical protein RRG08_018390 [Elysia crispata]|uniref:Uncharacterized protein n=1 Tax=Elysia crispata TaxID=231223 RepID=A0AAE1DWW2_9GAST|nr:hypothetical protein RRG08_018390 [Elysia crispata]